MGTADYLDQDKWTTLQCRLIALCAIITARGRGCASAIRQWEAGVPKPKCWLVTMLVNAPHTAHGGIVIPAVAAVEMVKESKIPQSAP